MNYTLNQLRIFQKIAQTGSVTLASEELHLTQPAVSIQLKKFQEQFDIALTETIGRKIYITEFGREVAIAAEEILKQAYAINYKAHEYKGQLTGKLTISVVSTGKYVMPYFLSDFINFHPGVELQMDVTNKSKVINSMENNEVDFSLVSVMPQSLQVQKIELIQNKLFLVGNTYQKFSKRKNDKEIFIDLPLIFREKGSGTRQIMERFIEDKNLKVLKKLELTSNEAVKQAVLAGLGYSIMPLIGIKNELKNNTLQIIPVKGLTIETNWSLIWLSEKKHSVVASSFLNFLETNREKIISEKFQWYEEY
jgi:DNA-binding transcriptional LysR family regulator